MLDALRRELHRLFGVTYPVEMVSRFYTWQQYRPIAYLAEVSLNHQFTAFFHNNPVPTLPQPRKMREA